MFQERKTKHFLHFFLFVITGGLWLPVWFLCWWLNARHNDKMHAQFRDLVASTRQPVNVTVHQSISGQPQQMPAANPQAPGVQP